MTTKLQAKFDGRNLIPLEAVDLPRDTVLDIHVDRVEKFELGSGAALLHGLQTLESSRQSTPEDVIALNNAIQEGHLAVVERTPFNDGQ